MTSIGAWCGVVNLGEEFGVGLVKPKAEKSDPQNPHFVSIRNFELTVMIGVRGNSNRGVSIRISVTND
jgi:hypothetical protein